MKKETAVDWLASLVEKYCDVDMSIHEIISTAKSYEKEQIINAFNEGLDLGDLRNYTGDKYYQENFE